MSEPLMNKSKMKLWFLIPLVVFIGAIIMFFFSLGKDTKVTIDTSLNRPVPTFQLPLLSDTSKVVTNEDLPNQPYLINVWGSWCPTCIVEHPFLMQLQQRGIDIVGVNYQDELTDAQDYLQNRGNPFVLNLQDKSGDMAIDLGLTGAPETFVVDSQGNIRQHILGEINQDNWTNRIEPCLAVLDSVEDERQQSAIAEVCV